MSDIAPPITQSEQAVSTPADAPAPVAAKTTGGLAAAKAALLAEMADDGPSSTPVSVADPVGDADPSPVVPAKAEEPKAEAKPALSPEVAAAAKADRRLQEDRNALKAERESFAAERTKWEQERGKAVEDTATERRKFLSDPVAYAEEHKWTAMQRYEAGLALAYSTQPEDKRPANWRGNGQGKIMSEVEQAKATAAQALKALEDFKQSQAQREAELTTRQAEQRGAEMIASAVTEATPLVHAFLAAHPEKAKQDFIAIGQRLFKELPEGESLTEAMVLTEYEKLLDAQSAWYRKKAPVPVTQAKPTSPPASATASPTRPTNGNGVETPQQKRERLKREAMEME